MKLKEIASFLSIPFEGDGEIEITGLSSLENAKKGDLSFFSDPKLKSLLDRTEASALIIPVDMEFSRLPVLRAQNPYLEFAKLMSSFHPPKELQPGIHPTAVASKTAKIDSSCHIGAFVFIGDNVSIGKNSVIMPYTFIGDEAKIGNNCLIYPNVTIRERVVIGDRVIIHAGTVIGSDGFGYVKKEDGSYFKVPQVGTVIIEDDVEIGANTTVDRATLGETRIGKGVKIDNLVQIGHNVKIGENTIIAAQSGIAGSSEVGKGVMVGGQVGIADHIRIGDFSIMAAKTGVSGNIASNSIVAGYPDMDIRIWRRAMASLSRLPDIVREIREIKEKIGI
ncbi:MAG: UDP-3-O-(3-hydroxymyristoyl)glucosamine N-acyltransferase [Candidatus Aminicenantia bacterium]